MPRRVSTLFCVLLHGAVRCSALPAQLGLKEGLPGHCVRRKLGWAIAGGDGDSAYRGSEALGVARASDACGWRKAATTDAAERVPQAAGPDRDPSPSRDSRASTWPVAMAPPPGQAAGRVGSATSWADRTPGDFALFGLAGASTTPVQPATPLRRRSAGGAGRVLAAFRRRCCCSGAGGVV